MFYYRLKLEDDRKRLISWWRRLDAERGERAILRRAETADDVLLTPAFNNFLQRMSPDWRERFNLFDSAMVAGLLARVSEHEPGLGFATALATPKRGAGKAAMSELRFAQLQKSRNPDEFFRRIGRALALISGRVDVRSLADDILHWLLEHRRIVDREPNKRLAVRWANDYYTSFRD